MTNKIENQSQNQSNNKKNKQVKIIEALLNFHTALTNINSSFEEFFKHIDINATKLQTLQNRLAPGKRIWRLEDIEHELSIILLSAGVLDQPQYLQFEDYVVEISKPKEIING